jgi:hypothetical protein
MKRMMAVALVATGAVLGAATAEAQTSPSAVRMQAVTATQPVAPFVPRRCSGVACLRIVPSLGVAF